MPVQTRIQRMLANAHRASRFLAITAILCVLSIHSAAARAQVEISTFEDNISIRANNVSASELAAQLSEELGIRVVVTGDIEARVNLDIVEEPLEKALGKLSPNNMLVRDSNQREIIEVVLMMGDASSSSTSSNEQFLPSGSPVDGVIQNDSGQPVYDASGVLNPQSAEELRQITEAASSDPNLPAAQLPPMFADEQSLQPEIDPATGLPYEQ